MKCKAEAIIILHGWPGSFWEFHKIISPLKKKINADIIIPSLPVDLVNIHQSYTKFNLTAVASILKELMEDRLGYKKYIVVGGDWGAIIAKIWGFLSCTESNSKLLVI